MLGKYKNFFYIFLMQTNTYQMVLATDEMATYAMFNYEYISWITHLDNYAGLNGPAAFVSH
jgi:CCR4-NOT transcriptional regulation complex NOT5 subunit